jgi:hypothetical protein
MHHFEKTVEHRFLIPNVGKKPQHNRLGDLVHSQDKDCQRRNAAVGRAQ